MHDTHRAAIAARAGISVVPRVRGGKTRFASEVSRAIMDGLDKARRGLWYIGISEG